MEKFEVKIIDHRRERIEAETPAEAAKKYCENNSKVVEQCIEKYGGEIGTQFISVTDGEGNEKLFYVTSWPEGLYVGKRGYPV
ncbi:hypothetical protein [uncultured Bartonella sp.]|uniref:hypothetical protein n=1 Tax=uncultured Bartonella sp. TaxID=104108 RepID=UPI0025F42381|nr:hypothetical protein [uncultured Bartonella sp.]